MKLYPLLIHSARVTQHHHLTITVIFSTKKDNPDHVVHLKRTSGIPKHIEVIQYINHQPKALALYYFGNNKNEIDTVINDTSSGQAVMNEWGFQYAYEDLPFGGVGPSGSGAYHGKEGFLSFSHNKAVLKGQKLINCQIK